MFTVQQTETFAQWLAELRDPRAKARIVARLQMVKLGHLGDVKPVGDGILEMRVDVGPGYRLYFARRRESIILLLCSGDKSTQDRDIKRAKAMVRDLEE
ncbi:MAG: type II toxin-antitoxin system RelE/ParE family toxin [Gammaproteobacteria bacterium]